MCKLWELPLQNSSKAAWPSSLSYVYSSVIPCHLLSFEVLVACRKASLVIWLDAVTRQEGHAALVQCVPSSLASEVDGSFSDFLSQLLSHLSELLRQILSDSPDP